MKSAITHDMTTTVRQISEHMALRGITMYRLAKMTGLERSTLSKVFQPNGNPKITTLERICFALDLEIIVNDKNN